MTQNPTIQPLCATCLRRTGCINVTDDCTACLHYSPVSGAVRPIVCDLECKFRSDSFNGCSEWARVESCEKWRHMRGAKAETVADGGMIREVEEVLVDSTAPATFNASGSKYLRDVPCTIGGKIDVYAVLDAFSVTCPARQHAIKKLLCTGIRGKGDALQDLKEASDAITRAVQMEEQKGGANATR